MSKEVFVVEFVYLGSFAMNCFVIEFFKKALAFLLTIVTNVLLSILQKFCHSHLWL